MDELIEQIKTNLNKPIVILGLMGAGKTKIGGLLASSLSLPFVDADHEIEAVAGCSVSDIFEQYGEAEFRLLERKVLSRLISHDVKVIAPGGGAVMNEETAELIWNQSLSIWLKADIDVLLERTGLSDKRPLLKAGNPRDILLDLMEKRYPVYGRANLVVNTDAQEPEVNLQKVLKSLADHLIERDNQSL